MKRAVILLISTIVLSGCSEGMKINSRHWYYYEEYKKARDYKALAVTPSGYRDASVMGIGQHWSSVQMAIQRAMERCEYLRKRITSFTPECRLHSIGDTDVSAMDEQARKDVIAKYQSQGRLP